MRTLIRPRLVLTMDAGRRIIRDPAILIDGNRIADVLPANELTPEQTRGALLIDAPSLVAVPGFVQTHVHLCQTLFRGLAEDLPLLDWLRQRIFPMEASHSPESIAASARLGMAELIRSGTTTIMDMGSVRHEDALAGAVEQTGLRAVLGKAMMDINHSCPALCESTAEALQSTRDLIRRWHGAAGGRIRYAVAPRFVLSCTDELLRGAFALTREVPGVLFHTHASENRSEMEAVRARCGMDNVEFFASLDVLHENTCLAHCIWLNEREMSLLQERRARVLHCPSSNLKLGSGIARIPEMLQRGIHVSLAADGAPCNNTLDMFQEMRLAALIQKPVHGPGSMAASTVLEMATIGGARALHLDGEIGSIEKGKYADLVLLDLENVWNPAVLPDGAHLASAIVHTGSPENVHAVMIDGVWVYRDGRHTTLDPAACVAEARTELHELLERTEVA